MKRTQQKPVDDLPPLPRLAEVVRYNTTREGKEKVEFAARVRGKCVAEFLRDLVEPQLDSIIADWKRSNAA